MKEQKTEILRVTQLAVGYILSFIQKSSVLLLELME